jgi:hypothetical protein
MSGHSMKKNKNNLIPENLDLLLLANTMGSGNGLQIVLRIEVAVEDDDPGNK